MRLSVFNIGHIDPNGSMFIDFGRYVIHGVTIEKAVGGYGSFSRSYFITNTRAKKSPGLTP